MKLGGIGAGSREKLATLIRAGTGTITPDLAASLLDLARPRAARQLSDWAKRGWLSRVRRGLYVPVPLEASTADAPIEDPWLVATSLFAPCYVAGWTAAEHWGLTEQIFRSVCIVTTRRPRDRRPKYKGTQFFVRTAPREALFGLKTIWRGRVKVQVSDPARTIVDMLSDPSLAGGIRPAADMLGVLLRDMPAEANRLVGYAAKLGNGAVFKRLGFLLASTGTRDQALLDECRKRLTTGYVKLDPKLPADRLITAWRLWIPQSWTAKGKHDRPRRDTPIRP